jgi:transcriptional regulator with XRE-family HTH domain
MDKNNINARQIKAARALLNWSQEDLAEASSLSITTIRKIESGHLSPRGKTTQAIISGLEGADIELIDSTGVRLRNQDVEIIEGDDCYLQLLDKIYHDMKKGGGEVLFMNADGTRVNAAESDGHLRLRKCGLKFRLLVEEGNTHLVFPSSEYRWVPKKYFKYDVLIIYQNKVAFCVYKKTLGQDMDKIYIINNTYLADAMKGAFGFMWDHCRQPSLTKASKL